MAGGKAPSFLDLVNAHTPAAIASRFEQSARPSYLRDWVHGGIDGAVTTFAILAGVAGANFSARVMLIVGLANLLADGFALAAGNFVATRAVRENVTRLAAEETMQIETVPSGEREEIRQLYAAKGFEGEDLDRVVDVITADRERWLATMLREEHGLPAATADPWLAAMSTFSAFVVCGAVPLAPLISGIGDGILGPALLATGVFVAIGALKSRWSTASWWRSGLETAAIGMGAAAIAYAVGALLRGLSGV